MIKIKSTELRDLLHNSEAGLVLKASEYFHEKDSEDAAFRLITGACQREFITLWKLFNYFELFEDCGRKLARIVRRIRATKALADHPVACNHAVTGSPAARQLLDYIHGWIEEPRLAHNSNYVVSLDTDDNQSTIEEHHGKELSILYLGAHGDKLHGRNFTKFKGKDVLLITDVIGRRGAVKEMARIIERFGGESIAVVAPIQISPDLILTEILTGKHPILNFSDNKGHLLEMHALVHFPIKELIGSKENEEVLTLQQLISGNLYSLDCSKPISLHELSKMYTESAVTTISSILEKFEKRKERLAFARVFTSNIDKVLNRPFLQLGGDASLLIHNKEEIAVYNGLDTISYKWMDNIRDLKNELLEVSKNKIIKAEIFRGLFSSYFESLLQTTSNSLEVMVLGDWKKNTEKITAFLSEVYEVFDNDRGFDCELIEECLTLMGSNVSVSKERVTHAVIMLFASFQDNMFDKNKTIRIDPLTNLPSFKNTFDSNGENENIKPLIEIPKMFEWIESSGAMDFGFYLNEQRTCTSAFRLPKLFLKHGNDIYKEISRVELDLGCDCNATESLVTFESLVSNEGDYVLVTTVSKPDLQFKEYLVDQTKIADSLKVDNPSDKSENENQEKNTTAETNVVLISRKDATGPSAHSHFLRPDQSSMLKQKHAVLLLATVQSAETLRHLSTLLARSDVKSITVVCLLNRMDPEAAEFVARMRRLAKSEINLGYKYTENDWVAVNFISIFDIPEFHPEDVWRFQTDASEVLNAYKLKTKIPSYKRAINQYDKYFEAIDVTSAKFIASKVKDLERSEYINVGKDKVKVTTLSGKLLAICSQLIIKGEYGDLIDSLVELNERRYLFKVVAILMGDIRFLRITGKADDLYNKIIWKIKKLRKSRFLLEEKVRDEKINLREFEIEAAKTIDLELNLFMALSLFSSQDRADSERFIWQAINWTDTESDNQNDFNKYPLNTIQYFSTSRHGSTVSILLKMGLLLDSTESSAENIVYKSVVQKCHQNIGVFRELETKLVYPEAESRKEWNKNVGVAVSSMQLLMNDLGSSKHGRKVDVIEFLASKLIEAPKRHNSIFTGLTRSKKVIDKLKSTKSTSPHNREHVSFWERKNSEGVTEDEIQLALFEGIRTVGVLEQIAAATEQLFDFTPLRKKELPEEFKPNARGMLFTHQTHELAQLFESAKRDNFFSISELKKISSLMVKVTSSLFNTVPDKFFDDKKDKISTSKIVEILSWYMTPLQETLSEAMIYADEVLDEQYGIVWENHREKMSKNDLYVVGLSSELREIFRNIFTNARHSLNEGDTKNYKKVSIKILEPTEIKKSGRSGGVSIFTKSIQIEIECLGKPYSNGTNRGPRTLDKHNMELENYGGRLKIEALSDKKDKKSGARVTIRLVDCSKTYGYLLKHKEK